MGVDDIVSQAILDEYGIPRANARPRVFKRRAMRVLFETFSTGRVVQHRRDALGQLLMIVRFDKQSIVTIGDHFRQPARARSNDGATCGHRFKAHDRHPFGAPARKPSRRNHHRVASRQQFIASRGFNLTEKVRVEIQPLRERFKHGTLRAIASDENLRALDSLRRAQ
jgi:hypothetical protein